MDSNPASGSDPAEVRYVNESIDKATTKYIVIAYNCRSDTRSYESEVGVKCLVDKLPHANVYKYRGTDSKPGTYNVIGDGDKERLVCCVFNRLRSGVSDGPDDSDRHRLKWFRDALCGFARVPDLDTVAFRYGEGFVDTGGKWSEYLQLITDFALTANLHAHRNDRRVTVFLYGDKPGIDAAIIRPNTTRVAKVLRTIRLRLPKTLTPKVREIAAAGAAKAIASSTGGKAIDTELLSTLGAFDPLQDSGWSELLMDSRMLRVIERLNTALSREVDLDTCLPGRADLLRAFQLCDYRRTRVVLIGQDPYPTPGDAHGLSFSVPRGRRIPLSLNWVFKALLADPKVEFSSSGHGCLESWASQGVLLLNSALTVVPCKPDTHTKIWKPFTDELIRMISNRTRRKLVFLLWGRVAQSKTKLIDDRHIVLKFSHPGASRFGMDFSKCRHFSMVNEFLSEEYPSEQLINWRL